MEVWTWPQMGSVLSCRQGNARSINLVSTDLFFLCFISPHSSDDTLSLSGYVNTYIQVWFCSMSHSVSLRRRSLSLSVLIFSFLQYFISKYTCILPTEPSSKKLMNAQSDSKWWQPHIWRFVEDFPTQKWCCVLTGSFSYNCTSKIRDDLNINNWEESCDLDTEGQSYDPRENNLSQR